MRNAGDESIEVMWGHHPAFGAPLIEPGCTISTGARTFIADDRAPGAGLEPGARSSLAACRLAGGGTIDLSVIPPDDEPRAVLGYLGDFDEGTYTISNPRIGLAATLRWPLDLFPNAWFWQELHGSPGYPWFRRMYTTAHRAEHDDPGTGHLACPRAGRRSADAAGRRDARGAARARARRCVDPGRRGIRWSMEVHPRDWDV